MKNTNILKKILRIPSSIYYNIDVLYRQGVELHQNRELYLIGILTLVVVVVIGFFGILPTAKTVMEKVSYKTTIKEKNITLNERSKKIKEYKKQMEIAEPYLENIYLALPKEFDIEQYLEDFVRVASSNGFIINSFTVNTNETENDRVTIDLMGSVVNASTLLQNIEEMNRVTNVVGGRVHKDNESEKMQIVVEVYSY